MDTTSPRRIDVDMESLAEAFDQGTAEILHYLDLETGEVISLTADVWQELEGVVETIPPDQADDEAAFRDALRRADILDWMRDALADAYSIESGLGTRYVEVEPDDPSQGYEDMMQFIDSVSNARLQLRLQVATRGSDAFRRFKDTLAAQPNELQRWYLFKEDRLRRRVLDWLATLGIEPIVSG